MSKSYTYSEIFHSIQGEGRYTGVMTAWLRFFLCNLQCDGFGQKNPMDPSTYVLPYKEIDVSSIKRIEDLPVFHHGCDTSYSWSAKFKHLQHKNTAREIYDLIKHKMTTEHNPSGNFYVDKTGTHQHMCFTGGESLMKHAQSCAIELAEIFRDEDNQPESITWETNATQKLTPEFRDMLHEYRLTRQWEAFCSMSPKLYSVSGEKDAIDIDNIRVYFWEFDYGQLKFVCNGTPEAWAELEKVVADVRAADVNWPIFIMPVGATLEGQHGQLEGHMGIQAIANEAIRRGYHVSARVHVDIWGNTIGT